MCERKRRRSRASGVARAWFGLTLCLLQGCAVIGSHATAARAMETSRTRDLGILHGVTYCFSREPFEGLVPPTCWTRTADDELWNCVHALANLHNLTQPISASLTDLERCMKERGWKEGNGVWVGGPQEGFWGDEGPGP